MTSPKPSLLTPSGNDLSLTPPVHGAVIVTNRRGELVHARTRQGYPSPCVVRSAASPFVEPYLMRSA